MTRADETAISTLAWLASEPEHLSRFLSLTGTDPAFLRQAAGQPGFMAGVIDFLMGHEQTLLAFCAATGTPPEDVVRAHAAFSGPFSGDDS